MNLLLKVSFLFLSLFGFTQVEAPSLSLLETNVKLFEVNKLNQIYVVKGDNSISKFQDGQLVITRNLKVEGELHHIDASNVFNILLFYKDLNSIISADNLLNLRSTLDFNNNDYLGSKQISAVARSFDNKIWVFDIISQRLLKIDALGKILLESTALPNQIKLTNVHHIIESAPYVFLLDSQQVLKMNIYGKIISSHTFPSAIERGYVYQDSICIQTLDSIYKESKEKIVANPLAKRGVESFGNWEQTSMGILFLQNDSLFLQQK